jgi:LysM repeat protein
LAFGALLGVAVILLVVWWVSDGPDAASPAPDEQIAAAEDEANGSRLDHDPSAIVDPTTLAQDSVPQPLPTRIEPPRITMGGALPPDSVAPEVERADTADDDATVTALAMPAPEMPEVQYRPQPEPGALKPGDTSAGPLERREALSRKLAGGLEPAEAQAVRDELTRINEHLVFSPQIVRGDPFSVSYTIQSGDALSRVVRRMGVNVEWIFIQRINRIPSPEKIHVGQRIKLITGPFHAVVDKSDFRLDLYLGEGSERVYVRSFKVGLGEFNSTPEGVFRVKPRSKTANPGWVNPRTRERFKRDDPANPIGEYWLGLEPTDQGLAELTSYGIHGTIDPGSIGKQRSMGCIRLLPDDVELVYGTLAEGVSTVQVMP